MDEKGNGKKLFNRYNSPRGARRRTIISYRKFDQKSKFGHKISQLKAKCHSFLNQ